MEEIHCLAVNVDRDISFGRQTAGMHTSTYRWQHVSWLQLNAFAVLRVNLDLDSGACSAEIKIFPKKCASCVLNITSMKQLDRYLEMVLSDRCCKVFSTSFFRFFFHCWH